MNTDTVVLRNVRKELKMTRFFGFELTTVVIMLIFYSQNYYII